MATMGFIQSSQTTPSSTSAIITPETFTHSIAFGQTGCGKTSSYIYPNLQNRIKLAHGILLFDYKGKEHLSVKFLADKAKRLGDVVEIGKPWGESINLIENMDEDELDKFFDNILKHGDDNKYWQNSAKSLGQSILAVLKAIDGFAKMLSVVDKKFAASEPVIRSGGFNYPTNRTLTSLVSVCKTFEHLSKFINELPSLLKTTNIMINRSIKELMLCEADTDSFKPLFKQLINSREKLKEAIEQSADALENFGEDSNENLTQNIMGSLTAPLLSLSQNSYFNVNSFDIVSALNDGKIIIINTESLSASAVESLNNTIMYELSKRTKSTNINPISVFIDEVQRVMSENTDLPIDVLREAKVDMFLATQNSALLKEKLKEEKYEALIGNLTRKYYFKNGDKEQLNSENELTLLDNFEYLSSNDDYLKQHSASALFITDQQRLNVEYRYQKRLKVLDEYLFECRREPLILEYISRLYSDNKIVAINIKTKKERVMESLNQSKMEYLETQVDRLFDAAHKELEAQEEELSIDEQMEQFLAS